MAERFEFLVEKEAVWADMLMQILKQNGIVCTATPVYGAGLTMYTGAQDRLKVYVPAECKADAEEILQAFFSEEA